MNLTRWGLGAALAIGAGCSKPPPPPPPSVVLVPAAEKSAHFDAVNRQLELGGTLYGYIDVSGDVGRLAGIAQTASDQVAKLVPELKTERPLDLKRLLTDLGFEDVAAAGISSVRETNGEFRDRMFFYEPNGRHGILRIFGGEAGPLHFAKLAPSDVDLFEEARIDVPAVCSAFKQIMIAAKGPEEEKKAEVNAEAGGRMAGVDVLALLRSMNGRAALMLQFEPDKTITFPGLTPVVVPRFSVLIGIENIGSVLQGVLDKSPLLQRKDEAARHYYTPRMPMGIDGIRPVIVIDGTTLYLGSSEFFTHRVLDGSGGPTLAQNAEFQRLQSELGADSNVIGYITPRAFRTMKEAVPKMFVAAPEEQRKMMASMMDFLPTPDRAQMSVFQNVPDGMLVRARWYRSFKQELLTPAIYNPITIGALVYLSQQQAKAKMGGGSAPSAAPQAQLTPDQKVIRNLRMLYVLGNAYFRRSGKTEAVFEDLIGPGKMLPKLTPAEGENYEGLKIEKGQPIRVTLPDGREMRYPLK